MCLHRERSSPNFTPAEAAFLTKLTPHLAEGLRTALLIGDVHIASRLLALEGGGSHTSRDLMPRTRLRTASGRWLVLHASRLRVADTEGRIAVIFEEARPSEIAPLIVDAYGLTKREGEITRFVLRGLSTAEVSEELHITPNTVRDHFKAIFDKVGVRSRRKLVGQVFAQQYQPRMATGHELDADGWLG